MLLCGCSSLCLDSISIRTGGIVRKIEIKYNNISNLLELDDLIKAGYIGLINAANKYDSTLENKVFLVLVLLTILMISALDSSKNCNIRIKDGLKSFEFKFNANDKNAFYIDDK